MGMTSFTDVFGTDTVPPSEYAYSRVLVSGLVEFVWPEQAGPGDVPLAMITELTDSALMATPLAVAGDIKLPPADQASVGRDFLLVNIGSVSYAIIDSVGNPVTVIDSGIAKYFYLHDNETPGGLWRVLTYGAGTSAADAASLAGFGLQADGMKLNSNNLGREIGGDYTITFQDRAHIANVIFGTNTISLPQSSAPGIGEGFWVGIRNSSIGSQTIEGFASETINGSLSFTLGPNESALFYNTGSGWITVGYGRDVNFVFSEYVVNAAVGDVTLSSSDVSGRMIRVSGTATQNFTVTLPTIDNIYFVIVEGGMGGFSVTFKTAIGIGVTLTANQNVILYCDGTNINLAVTVTAVSSVNLNDGSALNPSLKFFLDQDTGIFRPGSNQVGIAAGGLNVGTFTTNGLVGSVVFVPTGGITSTTVADALAELDSELAATTAFSVPRTGPTGSAVVPAGTTAQRDPTPLDGYMRFNATLQQFEGFYNGTWQSVGGGQLLGNAVTKAIFYNSQAIAENLTVGTGVNGGTFGPVTINDGFAVTVNDGSVWSIV